MDIARQGGSTSSETDSLFPNRCVCEFCDISFKCDLDVAKHLASQTHIENRDKFVSVQNPVDKVVQAKIPKNYAAMLAAIKVRSLKDLRDLADKNYFKIRDEAQDKLAKSFAKALLPPIIDFMTRDFPSMRETCMKAFQTEPPVKAEDQAPTPTPTETPESSQQQLNQSNTPLSRSNITTPRTLTQARATTNDYRSSQSASSGSTGARSNSRLQPATAQMSRSDGQTRSRISPESRESPVWTPTPPRPNSTKAVISAPRDPSNPQPRKDSTYKPTLAIIKKEPQDN